MKLSIIIITKNEAPRLRLCLTSVMQALLEMASHTAEVVVVDDGSTDETAEVIKEYSSHPSIVALRHTTSKGRSASRNAGVVKSSGEILFFLDGDTIISPLCLKKHLDAQVKTFSVMRGEVFHLRQTRCLRDPEKGELFPGSSGRTIEPQELITREKIKNSFSDIHAKALPGIYPGIAPRRLAELELNALRDSAIKDSLWMTATAHNISIPRDAFESVGGFCEQLEMNEHRELALSLVERKGLAVVLVEEAASYHLCHSTTFRDPLQILKSWEPLFLNRHPRADAKLLSFFWLTLAESLLLPSELKIQKIQELITKSKGDISAFERFRETSPLFGAV